MVFKFKLGIRGLGVGVKDVQGGQGCAKVGVV
jgi:hypothetical protein